MRFVAYTVLPQEVDALAKQIGAKRRQHRAESEPYPGALPENPASEQVNDAQRRAENII